MRLQHKVFTFTLPSGEKPTSRLLTSNLSVNTNKSDILMSDLFHSVKKEKGNTIKGYSILELLNENGEIKINDKIYSLAFENNGEIFVLSKISDPTDFTLKDREMDEEETEAIEKRIIDSVPAIDESSQQPDNETSESTSQEKDSAGTQSIWENPDYELEKAEQEKEGYVEYNTIPKSNTRLLVQESTLPETPEDEYEKIVIVEIEEDDFEIGIREEYNLILDQENKTFSYTLALNP